MGNKNHYCIALFLGTKAKTNIVSKHKMKKIFIYSYTRTLLTSSFKICKHDSKVTDFTFHK